MFVCISSKTFLFIIFPLKGTAILKWDFIIYLSWNTNYYVPPCASEDVQNLQLRTYCHQVLWPLLYTNICLKIHSSKFVECFR